MQLKLPSIPLPIIYTFFFLHLFMVLLHSLEINYHFSFLENYAHWTGADSGFKFFAPNVGSGSRAIFELHHTNGKISTHTLDESRNLESVLRARSLEDEFWINSEDKNFRRAISASWAAKFFALYPDSDFLTVKLQTYYLPNMEGWRKGLTPHFDDFYQAKFQRP